MTISYTTNFEFPMLDDGAGNSGAVINGVLETIDQVLNWCVYEDETVYNDDEIVYY